MNAPALTSLTLRRMLDDPRATPARPPQRPPIKNGFLHFAAELFIRKVFVERDPSTLEALWQFIDQAELFDDDDAGGVVVTRERATRADLLISVCRTVYCLLARAQVKSLRVGFAQQRRAGGRGLKHDMVGLSRNALADWSDRSERTVSMVCTLLRRAGLVHGPSRTDRANWIKQPCDRAADGSVEWKPAVRRFTFAFFAALGLGAWLAELRQGTPKPQPSAATVTGASVSKLAGELAEALALAPDG